MKQNVKSNQYNKSKNSNTSQFQLKDYFIDSRREESLINQLQIAQASDTSHTKKLSGNDA